MRPDASNYRYGKSAGLSPVAWNCEAHGVLSPHIRVHDLSGYALAHAARKLCPHLSKGAWTSLFVRKRTASGRSSVLQALGSLALFYGIDTQRLCDELPAGSCLFWDE